MGRILERFEGQKYRNEDEVKQNFLVPLFQEFLGYDLKEIIPEQKYPAREVHSGVYKIGDSKGFINKPDYVVCLDGDLDKPKFVIDAKGPDESIDDHLPQVKSYTLSVRVNLIVLSNGHELHVLDSNEDLFRASNLHELEVRFDELYRILSRESQSTKTLKQIIASINSSIALGVSAADVDEAERLSRQARIQGFKAYLERVRTDYGTWQLPYDGVHLEEMDVQPIDPVALYSLQLAHESRDEVSSRVYSCNELLNDFTGRVRLLIGESGIGKSTLLRYVAHSEAIRTLGLEQTRIPVYVRLRQVGVGVSLESIILRELEGRGYRCAALFTELSRYEFLFLLDGYDEIPKAARGNIDSEILAISRLSTCIVTARPKEAPVLPVVESFAIVPLDLGRIGRVVRQYLPSDHEKFFREVEARGLAKEMGNTLLLTLMLFLFKKERALPSSVGKISQRIVSLVYEWTSARKGGLDLHPSQLDELLGEIAFHSTQFGLVDVQRDIAGGLLRTGIDRLKKEQIIDGSWTTSRAIEELASTGLIADSDNGISFWHSMFQDYFTSIALAERMKDDVSGLGAIHQDANWTRAIEGAPLFMDDASMMISALLADVWMAATCFLNAQHVADATVSALVERLVERAGSSIVEIRDRAMYFLSKLNHAGRVHNWFREAFDSSPFVDVRMTALEEVARKGDEEARRLVLSQLDWDEGGGVFRYSSVVSVARAIVHLGGSELARIATLWGTRASLWDSYSFENICLNLLRQGKMTPELLSGIERLYLDSFGDHKRSMIASSFARVLSEALDESFVDDLILSLEKPDPEFTYTARHSREILTFYKSNLVLEKLQAVVRNKERSKEIRVQCAEILQESKADVPLAMFDELTSSEHLDVQVAGVRAFSRFPKEVVRTRVENFIVSAQPELQNAAIVVVINHGELAKWLREKRLPKMLYWPSLHTIVEGIANHAIVDGSDILDRIDEQVLQKGEERHLVKSMTWANASIGRFEKAEHLLLSEYYDADQLVRRGDYELARLMETIVVCRSEFATRVLLDVFALLGMRPPRGGHFLEDRFIESVEKVGTTELKDALKELVEHEIERRRVDEKYFMHIERVFRAFTQIGSKEDRRWILDVIASNPFWQPMDKKRAIECLARFGEMVDLDVIRMVAKEYPKNELVITTCLYAYESVLRRSGIRREVTELDLLG